MILPKFEGSCTHALIAHLVKFGTQVQVRGMPFHAKFHCDRHILLCITTHYRANMTNFGNFGGSCIHALRSIRAKFGTLEYALGICLRAKFHLDRFFVSLLRSK